jgi:hypothetical protein
MTAEIVNLNKYRKAKRKVEKSKKAPQNRVRSGRDKSELRRREYEKSAQDAQLDGNRLDDES